MTQALNLTDLDEAQVRRLADDLAFFLLSGDTIALEGELGSGKSTFARALLRSLTGNATLEVPSPTFTLLQSYESPRFEVAHLDLYRLREESELDELDLDEALKRGIAIIEWPERGGKRVAQDRVSLQFAETADPQRRNIRITGSGEAGERIARLAATRTLLDRAGWGDASIRLTYLQGDASPRRYARLFASDGRASILVDSPRRPDGPPIRDGKPYSAIAHLAEDVRAFVAVGTALSEAGFSAPELYAHDLDSGLLLIEDLGDRVFSAERARGVEQAPLWQRATDALAALQSVPPPAGIALPDGSYYSIPDVDLTALEIETQLLLDWYWPALYGRAVPDTVSSEFAALWRDVNLRVLAQPKTWLLRDYHSPNLLALDARPIPRDVGIIDYQDAMLGPAAYDLVSLLQDARVDVPEVIAQTCFERYVSIVKQRDSGFDDVEFRFSYAALGAQRNTKVLGIFARLAMRDGKRQYLAHLPRIWGYLTRDLAHEELQDLRAWYDRHLPPSTRGRPLLI